ncbi:MAG: hypothetical protein QE265_11360 [Rhodoferax sp.]|nr:hypothetical protein [Rhodoferax sp.]
MSLDQEKRAESAPPLPANETTQNSLLNETVQSLGQAAPKSFDNLRAQQGAPCDRYQHNDNPTVAAPPATLQPDCWARIPQELRERPQWCLAGSDKRPLAADGRAGSVSDPGTWNSFDAVSSVAAEKGLHIGYVLSANDPFTCIDLDVKEDTTQEQLERFQEIVCAADSYTERSRSGKGLHIWLEGQVGKGRRRDGVEVYSQERFIICTGDVYIDKPIRNRQEMLGKMVSLMTEEQGAAQPLPDGPEVETDETILQRATKAANGFKFNALFCANWPAIGHDDHSKADAQLVQMLAGYSPNNLNRPGFRGGPLG